MSAFLLYFFKGPIHCLKNVKIAAFRWFSFDPSSFQCKFSYVGLKEGCTYTEVYLHTKQGCTYTQNRVLTGRAHHRVAGMAQWWERSPSTNVSRVRFPDPAAYVGWVCCWFSSLLREVFLRVLRFSPLLKNQHFQILIRSGLLSALCQDRKSVV